LADGKSERKGNFRKFERERKSFKFQTKRLGRNRTGNETERGNHPNPSVDRKSKLADRGNTYWIISTGSPPIKILLWAKFLSFESSKDRSIEAELEVQIRKGKISI
jgi:hypothetical protein